MSIWTSWFIAAAIAFAAELFVGTAYLLVLSAAAFGAGLFAWLFHSSFQSSLFVASILSIIGISVVYWIRKNKIPSTSNQHNQDLDINEIVIIEQPLANNTQWQVRYRGTLWEAELAPENAPIQFKAGDNALIIGKKANTLLISPIPYQS